MVNHLQTMHYHLGLVCVHCLDYFTTNTEAMNHHAHVCKHTTAGASDDDNREEEDYEDDDNGSEGEDEDNKFEFEED